MSLSPSTRCSAGRKQPAMRGERLSKGKSSTDVQTLYADIVSGVNKHLDRNAFVRNAAALVPGHRSQVAEPPMIGVRSCRLAKGMRQLLVGLRESAATFYDTMSNLTPELKGISVVRPAGQGSPPRPRSRTRASVPRSSVVSFLPRQCGERSPRNTTIQCRHPVLAELRIDLFRRLISTDGRDQ
ncbi:hypothetical protein B0H34DRAFT_102250 [Crassisporium funariophilum]|nr:hypothetical protein B0H34DRAFT_102250 [Crassisporium funariophilum]